MYWRGEFTPVVDTHADSLLDVVKHRRHLGERSTIGQLDFPRMREAGHTLQCLSLWVEPEYKPERALTRLLEFVDRFWQELALNPDVVAVTDADTLKEALNGERLGVIMAVEGADAVGTDLGLIRILHRLGVRLMSLTWNERNALADGAGEDPGGGGLSRAGRQAISEMNRVGIVPDVSHLAHAAFWDVLETSACPPIASHSNCRALADHRRNLTDGQIRRLAQAGGVQGITFVREFLGGAADLDRVVDHMLHALALVGDDRHLGLGSDFDGVEDPVPGLEDVTALPRLAERMSARGLPDPTIRRIMGQNYVEFFQAAWQPRTHDML